MELKVRHRRWEDIIPVLAIRDDIVISRRGDLTVGWELSLPAVCTLSEDGYDAVILRYLEAVRKLPPLSILHRQDIYTYASYNERGDAPGSYLGRCYSEHFRGRRYLTHRAYLFLTLPSSPSMSRRGADSGYFGFRFSSPLPGAARTESFLSSAEEFIRSAFDPGTVGARMLTRSDYEGEGDIPGIIQSYATFGDPSPVMSHFGESRERVSYGGRSAVSFTVSDGAQMPSEVCTTSEMDGGSHLFLSFASRLGVSLDCEHALNHYMVIPPQDDIARTLERRRRRMSSSLDTSDNRVNASQVGEYLDEVSRSGVFTVHSHVDVIAWDRDDRVDALRALVSAAVSSMKISAVFNTINTPFLWYAGIPGAEAELGSENYMTTELLSTLCLCTWETFERGVDGGLLSLCDRMRGVPLSLDIQDAALRRRWIDNYNAFILGGSGSGKSFFTNLYLRECYDAGEHVFVIDVGDSYEGLCSVVNEESGGRDGIYRSWDAGHPLSFSPFRGMDGPDGWLTEEGAVRQDHPGVNFILSFLKTTHDIPGGWDSQRGNILSHILGDFILSRAGGQTAVLDDFYRFLVHDIRPRIMYSSPFASPSPGETTEGASQRLRLLQEDEAARGYVVGGVVVKPERFDIDGLLFSLEPYCAGGRFSFLMNSREPEDLFGSRFTVFEVGALSQVEDKKFYSLCILCIMNAFDVKMRTIPEFKVMVVEEAWKAIANETMAPYLAGLWKTARKYRTSAVVVTQQVSDILSSPVIRDTILQNSSVRVLLDQGGNRGALPRLQELLGITERECGLILSINRGRAAGKRYKEVFLKLGDSRSGVYATEVSPQEALCYESDKVRKAPYLRSASSLGFIRAANEMTGRHEES